MKRIVLALIATIFAGSAFAADVVRPPAPPAPKYMVQPAADSFAFVGVFGGASKGHEDVAYPEVDPRFNYKGPDFGAQAGFYKRVGDHFVVGGVLTAQWSGQKVSTPASWEECWTYYAQTDTVRQKFVGTAELRLGVAHNRVIAFGLAGVAAGTFNHTTDIMASNWWGSWPVSHTSVDYNAPGTVVGAGVLVALSEHTSFEIVGKHFDFGKVTVGDTTYKNQSSQITVGLNWHF